MRGFHSFFLPDSVCAGTGALSPPPSRGPGPKALLVLGEDTASQAPDLYLGDGGEHRLPAALSRCARLCLGPPPGHPAGTARGRFTEVVLRVDGGSDKETPHPAKRRHSRAKSRAGGRAGGRRRVWEVRLAVQDARGSPAPAGPRRLLQRPGLRSGPKLPPGSRARGSHPASLAWRPRSRCQVAATKKCGPCWAVWGRPGVRGHAILSPVRCLLRTPVSHGAGMEGLRCPAECRPAAAPNRATWSSVCTASRSSWFRRHGLILHRKGVGVIIISIYLLL